MYLYGTYIILDIGHSPLFHAEETHNGGMYWQPSGWGDYSSQQLHNICLLVIETDVAAIENDKFHVFERYICVWKKYSIHTFATVMNTAP